MSRLSALAPKEGFEPSTTGLKVLPFGLSATGFRADDRREGVHGIRALSCSNMFPLGAVQIRRVWNIGIRGETHR